MKRRARFAVGVAAAVIMVGGSATAYALTTEDEPVTATDPIAAADTGDVTLAVAATGTLTPAQTRSLAFGTSGAITKITVRAGDTVTAGQVLAEVDDAEAREAVQDAQDALDEAEDALATASSSVTCASLTGDTVFRFAAGPAPTPTPTSAPTPVDADRTTPAPAVTVTVTETVYVTVAPSTAPSAWSPPSASASPAPSRSSSSGGGQPSTGDSCAGRTGGGDAVYSAEKRVTSAEVALAEAKEALAGAVIKAPIGGRLHSVTDAVGTEVSAGSAVITLGDVGGMEVEAAFPEADAGRLAVGQVASVTLADRPDETFPATVTQVDPVGTSTENMVTYGTLISFDDVPANLLVGQSVQVTVTVAAVTGAVRVPSSAVRDVVDGTGTVTVRSGGADHARAVGVGLVGDRYTEITSGLAAGDQVLS